MSWNYRIFKRIHRNKYLPEPETLYEIRETYYDKDGNINGWAETPDVIGDSADELKGTLEKMLQCLDKPLVNYHNGKEL